MVGVKICGVTTVRDAEFAVRAGATMIGINLISASPRFVDDRRARDIVSAVSGAVETIGVVADRTPAVLDELAARTGLDYLQLHGDETDEALRALVTPAFKAVRIGSAQDAMTARQFSGSRVLVDARSHGALGGTGRTFDWSLVVPLARERQLILAGGLTAENVADAIRTVRPFAVDVASGVETSPGKKDDSLVRAFLEAVRQAS